jgi:hypothetical protein
MGETVVEFWAAVDSNGSAAESADRLDKVHFFACGQSILRKPDSNKA